MEVLVIVVGITVTLLSLLEKFQVRLTESLCTAELRDIEQTRSSASPTIACFGFDKTLGAGATVNVRRYIHKQYTFNSIHNCMYVHTYIISIRIRNMHIYEKNDLIGSMFFLQTKKFMDVNDCLIFLAIDTYDMT